MIELSVTNDNNVFCINTDKLHGYGAICSKCYKELRFRSGLRNWLYCQLENRPVHDVIKLPCGCSTAVSDINSSMVFIDEWIVPYISKMNIAGYKTDFSCAGHVGLNEDGYVSFKHDYDDLVNWIINHPRLLNVIDLEYWCNDGKDFLVAVYNRDNNEYDIVQVSDGTSDPKAEFISIRMKPGSKLGDSFRSRFEKLRLFRKILNEISNWCLESSRKKQVNSLNTNKNKE